MPFNGGFYVFTDCGFDISDEFDYLLWVVTFIGAALYGRLNAIA